ncbi:MAG: hypothetical protein QXX08_07290 [Candidatus Bathyarchaeia archaeon]
MLKKLKDINFWRDKCLNDLYFLCRVILQTLEDPTPGFKDMYKPTHKLLCDFVTQNAKPEQEIILLCPRGWLKSYIVTVGFTIQLILRHLAGINKRGESILIANATLANAQQFLKKIKYNLEHNELLRQLFPEIPREPEKEAARWTMDEIQLGKVFIEVGSAERNLISKHYSILINDDLVNKDNCNTAEQIEKIIDWWKLARSLLESKGFEIIIGTRYNRDDLYGYLLERFLEFTPETYIQHRSKAIVQLNKNNYHYLRITCWADPENERGSTFPTLFSEDKLKRIQAEQAEFFSYQYLNDVTSESDAVFKRSWIQHWRRGELPEGRITYMLVDPSGKETTQSDRTGIVVVDAGIDKRFYVIYAKGEKMTDLSAVEEILKLASYYQPALIGIEEGKFETFRDLAYFLIPQMIKQNKFASMVDPDYINSLPNIFVPLKHRNRPKELRVKNLTGWFESGKLLLPPTGYNQLLDELLFFGKSRYDDIVDALAYCLDICMFPSETGLTYQQQKAYCVVQPDTPAEREKQYWENEEWRIEPTNLLGDEL